MRDFKEVKKNQGKTEENFKILEKFTKEVLK